MKKLALTLCIISSQAFGMEQNKTQEKKSAFTRVRSIRVLYMQIINSLAKNDLSPAQRSFACALARDLGSKIQEDIHKETMHASLTCLKRALLKAKNLKKFE